jgi:NTE family protein
MKPLSRRSKTIEYIIVALVWIFSSCGSARCGENLSGAGPRPKIGLVLGGGGARGAAHVGVLKVLEENRVPIDLVVGTSMGAIVGGLYAAGMPPADIEETIENIDWVDIFKDRPSEEYLSFRNKKDLQRLVSVETGIKKGGLRLPRGVIAGQKLGFELKKLTLPVAHINDFDELSLPFRAVATDLRTGEVVVHEGGNLSEAIRSSMSIPGIFPPVEIDGRVLVDGFIVNNVPIEIAKDMGADIIIAVDVGGPLPEDAEFETFIDVTEQLLALLSRQNVEKSLSLLTDKDLLIRPDLGDIGTDSFTRTAEAIKRGETSSRKIAEMLGPYSVPENEYRHYLATHRQKVFREPVIDFVKVVGDNRVSDEAILGRVKTKRGTRLDLDKLKDDLTRVYSIDDFETVDFKIVKENGKNGLLIDPKEKPWGPNYLRFGLNLSNDTQGDSEYSVLFDHRMTQLNRLGGEWKNVAQFGGSYGFLTEFYQPLDRRDQFFVSPQFYYQRELNDVYQGDMRIAEYEAKYLRGGIGTGINFRSFAQVRADYLTGIVNAEPQIGGTGLPGFNEVKEGAIMLTLDYDQLDNHKFPKRGIKSFIAYFISDSSFGGDLDYEKMEIQLAKAKTFSQKHTLIWRAGAGFSPGKNTPFYDQFTLGGFLNLSGFGERQLRGQHKGILSLLYYYGFKGSLYLGGGLEYGNVWNERSDIDIDDGMTSGIIFAGLDTVIGPLYFGYAQAEGGPDGRFYLFLGKTF